MPRGKRPSIAASTMSGARNANEIVIAVERLPRFSRTASFSMSATRPVTISSSQARPLAMDCSSVARVSEVIGRRSLLWEARGAMISREGREGRRRHGTRIEARPIDRSPSSVSSIPIASLWTVTRATFGAMCIRDFASTGSRAFAEIGRTNSSLAADGSIKAGGVLSCDPPASRNASKTIPSTSSAATCAIDPASFLRPSVRARET